MQRSEKWLEDLEYYHITQAGTALAQLYLHINNLARLFSDYKELKNMLENFNQKFKEKYNEVVGVEKE